MNRLESLSWDNKYSTTACYRLLCRLKVRDIRRNSVLFGKEERRPLSYSQGREETPRDKMTSRHDKWTRDIYLMIRLWKIMKLICQKTINIRTTSQFCPLSSSLVSSSSHFTLPYHQKCPKRLCHKKQSALLLRRAFKRPLKATVDAFGYAGNLFPSQRLGNELFGLYFVLHLDKTKIKVSVIVLVKVKWYGFYCPL